MPMSDAKRKANKKWNDSNLKERYDRIQLVVPKGQKDAIQSAAQKCGESVNGFIWRVVQEELERMAQDGQQIAGGSSGFSEGVSSVDLI